MRAKKYWTCTADIVFVKRDKKYHDNRVCEDGAADLADLPEKTITCNSDAADAARELLGDLDVEGVVLLMLNNSNRLIGACRIALGINNQCAVYPRNIFTAALLSNAVSIILAHNHPSGADRPSENDWNMTKNVHAAGKLLEIPLLDHLILAGDKIVSLRESPRWPA
jgi:DNA repair protein RadC